MRSIWAACILALALGAPGVEAKGFATSSVSSRSSFSRGFSATKPAGGSASKSGGSPSKSAFGAFSSTRPSSTPTPAPATAPQSSNLNADAAPAQSSRNGMFASSAPTANATLAASGKSALSSGLEKNAAQDNALKTFDRRNGTAAGTNAGNNAGNSAGNNANAAPGTDFGRNATIAGPAAPLPPVYSQPGYPVPHTVIVRDGGSSWGSNLMWFMLGRSMSEHRHYDAPYAGGSGYQNAPGSNDIAVPHESFGWSVLRIFLWLAILSAIGWAVWFAVRRKSVQAARRHYIL